MKKPLLPLLLTLIATFAVGQSLPYTPTPMGAYLDSGGSWSAWNAVLGSQTLGYTPTAIGLYCSTNGTTWQPCNPTSGGSMVWPSTPGITTCTGTPCTAWGTSYATSGTGTTLPTTQGPTIDSANLTTSITTPVIHAIASGAGGLAIDAGTGTSGANYVIIEPSTSNVGAYLSISNGRGGGVAGGLGQTAAVIYGQPDSTNYANPITRWGFNQNNAHLTGIAASGVEGGEDSNGNLVAVTGTQYGTHHWYNYDLVNGLSILDYQPDLTLASATTTTLSNTVAYTGSFGRSQIGDKIFGVGCGLPGSGYASYPTIATITAGTGFTYTGTAVTTGATCNVYVIHPQIGISQHTLFANGASFYQTSLPTATSCGSGSVSASSADNAFAVTGITTATSCTVTTANPLVGGVCTANSSQAATPVQITSITTTTTHSVIVFGFAALTGTLYSTCF